MWPLVAMLQTSKVAFSETLETWAGQRASMNVIPTGLPTACSDLGMCAEAAPPLRPQSCEDVLTGLFPGKTGACLLLPHCSLAGGWLRTVCLLQSCGAWEGKPGWLPEPGD